MPKVTPLINNFNAGEISPLLDTRTDFAKYFNGCRTLENALPLVEGGAKKMPGTVYVTPSNNTAGKSRLVRFSFSTDQSYVLEFSHKLVRIFTDDGLLLSTAPGATDYDPATLYSIGNFVKVGNYWDFDFGSAKYLYVSLPLTEKGLGITLGFYTNSTDTLEIKEYGQAPYSYLVIFLANATPAKNSAALIQAALRAKGTVSGCNFAAVMVTENAAYAASRPIAADLHELITENSVQIYEAIAASQYNYFPPVVTAKWSPYTTGEGTPVTVVTPYLEQDLFDLDVSCQSADMLFIFHHLYPAAAISRRGATVWTYDLLSFLGTPDITKVGYNKIGRLITNITNDNPGQVYSADHGFMIGDTIFINHVLGMLELNEGRFTIGGLIYNVSLGLIGYTLKDMDGNAVDTTDFGVFVAGGSAWAVKLVSLFDTPGNYPGCATFFEQRLILSGFDNYPMRAQGSVAADFYNFTSDPGMDDYAIQFDLVSKKVDPVQWMVSQQKIALGTASGVWILGGPNGTPLTQTNFDLKMQITIGAAPIIPEVINDSFIWLTRVARIVRLLQYTWQNDQWIAPDLTRIARHIADGSDEMHSGIIQTAFQAEPFPILWAIRADGQLLGMTFESQEQVYAWCRIVTQGRFESVCVVPRQNNEDRVWVVTNRNLD